MKNTACRDRAHTQAKHIVIIIFNVFFLLLLKLFVTLKYGSNKLFINRKKSSLS